MSARTIANLHIPLRDGGHVSCDVLLPQGRPPWPTVIFRTPYMRRYGLIQPEWATLVDDGYAFVVVDTRGRGDSSGSFQPLHSDHADGYDVVEWCAIQPWSNGMIGMVGISYDAATQWFAARAHPPHLRCIAPFADGIAPDEHRGAFRSDQGMTRIWEAPWLYSVSGRTFQAPESVSWESAARQLPLRGLAERTGSNRHAWNRYLDGRPDQEVVLDSFTADEIRAHTIPTLVGTGWWDSAQGVALRTWLAIQDSAAWDNFRLLIGPWDHQGNTTPRRRLGGHEFGPFRHTGPGEARRLLDTHLRGDEAAPRPARATVYRTGRNEWEYLPDWPAPSTPQRLWLVPAPTGGDGDGQLQQVEPDATDVVESRFDPHDPPMPLGGLSREAPLDTRYLHRRHDCLTYSTSPCEEPTNLSGAPELHLTLSTTGRSLDLVAWLCDVDATGRTLLLGPPNGVRARYRCADNSSTLVTPDEPFTLTLRLAFLHHTVLPGHALRLAVTWSWFPWLSRGTGSALDEADAAELTTTTNRIHVGRPHRSFLVLPTEDPLTVTATDQDTASLVTRKVSQ